MSQKVDKATFSAKMKEVLDEMNEEDNNEVSQNGSECQSPKRKGKVGCI